MPTDFKRGVAAFTAVLIVACPCALALSTPFTMSAALSIFDKNLFYLKNTRVVEQMAAIDTIVMDKTGTITTGEGNTVKDKAVLTDKERQLIYSVCINSIHPLSRMIYRYLGPQEKRPVSNYHEVPGEGILATVGNHHLRVGNELLVFGKKSNIDNASKVLILIDDVYCGYFEFAHQYRDGLSRVTALLKNYKLFLLSGDRDYERQDLVQFFKEPGAMHFDQSPQDKLNFINALQKNGRNVMMIGDGLNDSGALKQSDLGLAVTDNVNNFSPGSDAILDGKSFNKLPAFLRFSKDAVNVIHLSFLISLTYNLVGLSYAVTGKLSPLIAAILMPLSTATIIGFTTIATHFSAKKRHLL
jgi:Cu+-exporting ATPase